MKGRKVKYGIGLFKRGEEWMILFWTKFFKVINLKINLIHYKYTRNKFADKIFSYVSS